MSIKVLFSLGDEKQKSYHIRGTSLNGPFKCIVQIYPLYVTLYENVFVTCEIISSRVTEHKRSNK